MALVNAHNTYEAGEMLLKIKSFREQIASQLEFENQGATKIKRASAFQDKRSIKFAKIAFTIMHGTLSPRQIRAKHGLTSSIYPYYDKLEDDAKFVSAIEQKRPGPPTKTTNELIQHVKDAVAELNDQQIMGDKVAKKVEQLELHVETVSRATTHKVLKHIIGLRWRKADKHITIVLPKDLAELK